MIRIEVEFLTGRYVATRPDGRDQAEWPPHPARFYSALVDAWGTDGEAANEQSVLELMEEWGAPAIDASDAWARDPVTHYVPVNDTSVVGLALQERQTVKLDREFVKLEEADTDRRRDAALTRIAKARDVSDNVANVGSTPVKSALGLLPSGRNKQPRIYPSMTPERPTVSYVWEDAVLDGTQVDVLDGLLQRVTRLGHSSSMVTCRLAEGLGEPRFVPDDLGTRTLRTIGKGQHAALVAAHAQHQASKPRALPSRTASYRDVSTGELSGASVRRSNLSGPMIVFERREGPRLPLTRAVVVARAVRGSLMANSDPVSEVLSGHDPSGAPLERPHAAFVALPFVGHRHATGHVMGAAIVLPTDVDRDGALAVADAVARWRADDDQMSLTLGELGRIELVRSDELTAAVSLRPVTWTRPSRTWLSVTPIALSRHPGALWGRKASQSAFEAAATTISKECRYVDLPTPADVDVTLDPRVAGSRSARDFPPFRSGKGGAARQRALVHARLRFDEPVGGPILLGSGRHLGLGLMRPADADGLLDE